MIERQPTDLEILIRARELISKRACWTQGAAARDADGFPCGPTAREAKSWCAIGALYAAYGSMPTATYPDYILLRRAANDLMWPRPLTILNDHGDPRVAHALMLRIYDRAIELARETGR